MEPFFDNNVFQNSGTMGFKKSFFYFKKHFFIIEITLSKLMKKDLFHELHFFKEPLLNLKKLFFQLNQKIFTGVTINLMREKFQESFSLKRN